MRRSELAYSFDPSDLHTIIQVAYLFFLHIMVAINKYNTGHKYIFFALLLHFMQTSIEQRINGRHWHSGRVLEFC